MIGHFLATLTLEQEDRVLTATFEPYTADKEPRCLVDVAYARRAGMSNGQYFPPMPPWQNAPLAVVGSRYDDLGGRFGTLRINAVIRNRILSNRARRMLTEEPLYVGAPTEVAV